MKKSQESQKSELKNSHFKLKELASSASAALILIAVLFGVFFANSAMASDKEICKVKTNDIGTIIGRGSNSQMAFEDAATQCFERRAQLYRMKKSKSSIDEDSGLVMIDMCANIACG
jgi:hypothetical protein